HERQQAISVGNERLLRAGLTSFVLKQSVHAELLERARNMRKDEPLLPEEVADLRVLSQKIYHPNIGDDEIRLPTLVEEAAIYSEIYNKRPGGIESTFEVTGDPEITEAH